MEPTSDNNIRILTNFFKAHILYVGMFIFIIVLTYMTVSAKKVSDNWQATNSEVSQMLKEI
ncbi:MAG: hypothetical protein PHN69_02775 [Candidatus Pacebacteria bacterium]|nr:hypothetical protein [Candidatus Paceibacterota bacterium]